MVLGVCQAQIPTAVVNRLRLSALSTVISWRKFTYGFKECALHRAGGGFGAGRAVLRDSVDTDPAVQARCGATLVDISPTRARREVGVPDTTGTRVRSDALYARGIVQARRGSTLIEVGLAQITSKAS